MGRSSTPLTKLKTAVVPPMPSARMTTTIEVKAGRFKEVR
jgi:hypothetical protein